eukprot:c1761_g1_i1.p1 GENE.c1761_g1_i1~~c1761_g1_i1.p1  ORF type:complete len:119 (-),score=34.99 c1761_g1_i1:159-515(-)
MDTARVWNVKPDEEPLPSKPTTPIQDDTLCPLFASSLPPSFSVDPALAALATFMPGEEDNNEDEPPPKYGRQNNRYRSRTSYHPYTRSRPEKQSNGAQTKPNTTSVSEAQLFLTLWKL